MLAPSHPPPKKREEKKGAGFQQFQFKKKKEEDWRDTYLSLQSNSLPETESAINIKSVQTNKKALI